MTRGLILGMYVDLADFTDWMSFLPSNLIKEINPYPETPGANT